MRSMTGYGRGRAPLGAGELVIELRAVNHRFLEVKLRFPGSMSEAAAAAEEIARGRLDRGRIEVTCRTEGQVSGQLQIDAARARTAMQAFGELRDELAPGQEVPLSLLQVVPELFTSAHTPNAEVAAAARAAMQAACDGLEAMRAREGEALHRDLSGRVSRVRALSLRIAEAAPEVAETLRTRLVARIRELLEVSGTTVDNGRLEHEIALQADRADISEELTRLGSHCDQFDELLTRPEPIGRRLEFLLQEMGREVNTTGAKVSDLGLTRSVLDLKAELERLREQVQNVL